MYGVRAPLKIVMEFHLTKNIGKYIGLIPIFLQIRFEFDEDIKQYSLASC